MVLGPLLFLYYLNNLPDAVKSTVTMDDHLTLYRDLQRLETWAITWGMIFNAKKHYLNNINTKSMNFYQLGRHILQQVPENPHLGVTLFDDLKWSPHIRRSPKKKASSTLGFLKKNLKHCLTAEKLPISLI